MRRSCMFTVLSLAILGCAYSQKNSSFIDNVLQRDDVSALKNKSELHIEEAKNLFKEKCTRNGGPNAFDEVQRAQTQMKDCIQSLINITELQAEMEKYKPTGDLDIVFKNYCNKRYTLRACVNNFTDTMEQCLEEKEKENKKIVLNITDSLLNFICYKEGDRIALFISAGGPECFQEKQPELQDCANRTFGDYMPKTDSSLNITGLENLPILNFGIKECRDMTLFQSCVVTELEKCPDPTPANIMDSIFNFIKRVTPCENLLNAQSAAATGRQSTSSASHISAFSTIAILSICLSLKKLR